MSGPKILSKYLNMRSNRSETQFGITSFGESHGPAMGIVIEDIRPNLQFPIEELNNLLSRRKPGSNPYSTSRRETDDYQIISGVFEGKTTGMPICILFWNKDAQSNDYETLRDVFRPGHADFAWFSKFKIYDYRGGGRASGRETVTRIAASAFVSEIIKPIRISFQTLQVGKLIAETQSAFKGLNDENPFCWLDGENPIKLYDYLDDVESQNETVGGIIRVKIDGVQPGLGDPVFEKLNANLAKALFSIGSIRGVSFGDGFEVSSQMGSESNDQMDQSGFLSNHSGGISGGISTGQPILINIAVKAVSSHGKPQKTINKSGISQTIKISGRHDICHLPRLLPVIEAMIKLTLADAIAWQKQLSGETLSLADYREALDKLDEELLLLLFRRKKIVEQVKKYKSSNQIPFRDENREKEMLQEWQAFARELKLPIKDIPDLLNLVLKICRNDNPHDTI